MASHTARFRGCRTAVALAGLAALGAVWPLGASEAEGSPPDSRRALSARSWVIEDFHSEVLVQRSGRVEVTETLRVRFEGSYNGIFRAIPVQYRTRANLNYTLGLSVQSVEDGAGQALRHELSRERHYRKIKIWVPGAADAVRTVVIRYSVDSALRFFEEDEHEWDEFYWNVTGDEWPVPIESASARIRLPAAVTGIRARGFTGRFGSTDETVDLDIGDFTVDVRSGRRLGIQEGLTVTVAWDSRIGSGESAGEFLIRRPTAWDRIRLFLRSNWPLLIPVLVLFVMHRVWRRHGRDPERLAISARYESPEGLTPSEVGVLVDNRPDLRDITAMLVDLSVRGYMRIEETEVEKFLGLLKEQDYVFELRLGARDWDGLKRHERSLLSALFGGGSPGDRVLMSDLKNEFYKHLPGIRSGIFDELISLGYYRSRPDRVLGAWIAAAVVVGGVVGFAGMAMASRLGMAPLTVVLAAALTGLVIFAFGIFMPARTVAGARALEQVLGLEEFLSRVETDRFRRMITGPEMFERLLPFAMALGVEEKWAAAFADICREPPDWYHGTRHPAFHPAMFVSDLSGMTSRAATTMTSAPRSSGGSGFSGGGGGGFSGGGFGGGGGGAF